MATFKVPQSLPQDLLLISEFVDVPEKQQRQKHASNGDDDDDIASSGSDSEEEIEKDLTALPDKDQDESDGISLPSDSSPGSSTDSSDSDSDSEPEAEEKPRVPKQKASTPDFDDDEEAVPSNAGMHPQTRNEIVDVAITIPDLEEVSAGEQLDKVGDVMSIVDNVAIIRGLPSEYTNRGSEKALDSGTLLVFGDRKVMGYIYETFGPTSQPFYQVKFNQAYPLNPERVHIGREVFHVPRRSHFVFVNHLKQFKGSDASNVHDEEPAEDELEFSDDEAEAVYRSRLKRKRNDARASSVSSSRQPTPAPSQMRDQDMMNESILSKSAFDEHGPYDLDYGVGPSRPTPQPYDDPYSDTYNSVKPEAYIESYHSYSKSELPKSFAYRDRSSQLGDGRVRGRGRGRGRRSNANTRGPFCRDGHYPSSNASGAEAEEYDPRMPHESLPSPYLQGQNNYAANYPPATSTGPSTSWGYPNKGFGQSQNQPYVFLGSSYHQPYAQPSTFVQPHINPRFASAFGLQVTPTTPPYTQGPSGPMVLSTASEQGAVEQWSAVTTPKQEERTS